MSNVKEASRVEIQKFKEILSKNGILDKIKNVSITEPPEIKGEHFATSAVYVRIQFESTSSAEDSDKEPMNLFMKKFSSNEPSVFKEMHVMEKESSFFKSFLPALKLFCANYEGTGDLLNVFPKCLHADDEMIVFENVVLNDGFIMLKKDERQDIVTAKHVLRNLAIFHATTYAFIEKTGGGEEFRRKWELQCDDALLSHSNPVFRPYREMFDNSISNCIGILKNNPVEGAQDAIDILQTFLGKAYKEIFDILTTCQKDKIISLNHGDCHNNNLLFKKDPSTGEVIENILVDLQITRLGSPNLDLGLYLYTSVKPDLRRAHLKELLKYYFDIFGNTIALFKIPVPISFEEFLDNYKRNSMHGFYANFSFICAIGPSLKDISEEIKKKKRMKVMMQKKMQKPFKKQLISGLRQKLSMLLTNRKNYSKKMIKKLIVICNYYSFKTVITTQHN